MIPNTLVVEGVSEEQIQKDIKANTKGYRLFFEEPTGATYSFINTFWGKEWKDYSATSLKNIILSTIKVEGKCKHFILVFKKDGIDRAAFCSWTRQLYDFKTKEYLQCREKYLSKEISAKILGLDIREGLDKKF